ncbi:pentatricopeptide repeat-containing family protein [Tripterygium wilfordii]|uniref:Pentatricopeptide repeat-containing family protein n=1 Tax=Tripterygium wilfordii TaxID=458696 RepID=A0A7J7BVS4_TRIWF|nr:pentatricopeptide repeat-containing protein At3g09040, mitochondrial [Tripterygium wilfordii]XP_038696348.1 pentatricopeptide repeat-containing protein At3g09040, mitochondrial [Tripterygium wilfordii]XP_038696349.1 pentatricopeptide repeat-containing protein At3g09040, mitochondrial [Tripterygium wilfordii]XP_038696350.1 pentatricopeptide repeat-containing protein At3g09040, mitochondrial [Tripterygium wilfordii]XP_038696352.1 pentatricopeptide repeat-containing protein At3g09040, mitochond
MVTKSMRLRFRSRRTTLFSYKTHGLLHRSTFSTIRHESSCFNQNHIQLVSPQLYTYASLLDCCIQECKRIKTDKVFDKMPQRILQASMTGKVVHGKSLKLRFGSTGLLGNMIVDLYAKCGLVELAEKAFNRLEIRNISAWNSILSAYLNQGNIELVVESFGLLWSAGRSPNEFTFASVLSACARLRYIKYARHIHCHIVKMGFESSSFCEGALIAVYTKCNCVSDAQRVFGGAMYLDTVSWTSHIAGFVQVGLPEEALKLFKEMQKAGHEPDQVVFGTVIDACINIGMLDDACQLFFQMSNPNVVAWNVMISGHAKRGFHVEAIEFFLKMRKVGIRSTRSTLGSLLTAISNLEALHLGFQVHAEAIKEGLYTNVYVGSALISMYAKCENMEAMKEVFDALDEKNIVLWNAALGGYVQNGCPYEVMELFSDMNASGLHPDEFTCTSVLSACGCLEYREIGHQLHTIIIKKKLSSNLFVGNALVDMYAKSGALKEARQQFDRMRTRDKVSWNAIIVGYVQEEDEVDAFNMFRRMIMSGIVPDEVSLSSILRACANVRGLGQAKLVHCLSIKSGLETGLYSGSALIDVYGKCGVIEAANKILSCMPQRSIASMNALIAGYAQNNLGEAINIFREMQAGNLKPNQITFASLLDACNGPQKLSLGKQIHCLTVKMGLLCNDEFLEISLLGMYMNSQEVIDANILFSELSNPKSTVLCTAMISGYIHNQCSDEALQVYREMRSYSVLPDQATFVCVLKACAILSSLREGKVTHSLIFHTGFDLDEPTGSALVDMYAKCGDVKGSVQVFEEMRCKHDIISWNSMINGFAKNGYAEDALRIFDEMKQTNILPDVVTFLGVLAACSHSGRVSEGRQVFDIMVNYYKIQPRVDHCACMIDVLGRGGLLKEAEEFIDKLDFEPDAKIWSSMLGACRIHGDYIRGQRAAEKLIELEPQNSSPYVLLSNIYAASGNWNGVNALRKAMREQGVKKLPGCSWIGLGQKTYLFVAGDKCHPGAIEIDALLKDLTELMKDDGLTAESDPLWHENELREGFCC